MNIGDSCAELLEQRVVDGNSTQSVCKLGNRVIVVDGICTGTQTLGTLLLEIAAEKIKRKSY